MTSWYAASNDIELEDNTIHIWLNYLNIHQARLKHVYPLLSADEKERSEKFKHFKHRKRFIASHGFMRDVLARYLNTQPQALVFKRGERGKPFLDNSDSDINLQFNLSHSNNVALLAVRKDHDIGVDIEYMERDNEWAKLIRRFFTQPEQDNIFALPEDQQKKAFFQVWTRKEAHMKVTGEGLHLAPGQFTVSTPPDPAAFIENHKTPDQRSWYMQDIIMPEMYADYCGCVSSSHPFDKALHFISS